MSLMLPGALQIETLAQHVAQALNVTRQALALFIDETSQRIKMVLQNLMALALLTATQGGISAFLLTKCCIYIFDHQT